MVGADERDVGAEADLPLGPAGRLGEGAHVEGGRVVEVEEEAEDEAVQQHVEADEEVGHDHDHLVDGVPEAEAHPHVAVAAVGAAGALLEEDGAVHELLEEQRQHDLARVRVRVRG